MKTKFLFLFLLASIFGWGQISITSLPYNKSDNFDGYNPTNATNATSTIAAGWTYTAGSNNFRGRTDSPGNSNGLYGLGTNPDYSLGALRTGSNVHNYSISFTNNSGATITALTISWNYEQWSFNNTSGWNLTGTGQLSSNTTVNATDFIGVTSGTKGDSTPISLNLNDLNITNGQSFGFSFSTTDVTGADNAISIDDFSISATGGPIIPPTVALSSSNPASTAGNLVQGSTNNVIYGFNLAVTDSNATLNQVDFQTVGGYSSAEVSNYKLWYSTDAAFSAATDSQIANITASAAGAKSFTSLTQNIAKDATGYFFITTDIPCNASTGQTLRVNAITTAGLTFSNASATKTGTASNGATHTFTAATVANVTSPSTSNCTAGQTRVNWTNPTTCFTEVYVFAKAGTFTSAVPTGNGSTLTAHATFGNGTASNFDGGQLVYKGTLATVLVNGLTNGTNYTYKIFTRNGTEWSSGVTTNCTPTVSYCTPTASSDDNTGITYVGFNTIAQTSTGAPAYTDNYNTVSTTVEAGATVPLHVRVNTDGNYTTYVNAWVDWDNDGDFTDETTINLGSVANVTDGATSASPQNVIIPNTPGTYRMRVRARNAEAATPCNNNNYSEAEDYKIIVIPAGPPATVTITAEDYNSAPSNWYTNSTNNIFYYAAISPTGGNANLSSVTANMSGTYLAADIPTNGFKLYYSPDYDFVPAGDVLLASRSSAKSGATENITWNSLSGMPTINAGGTGYIYAVADIATSATPGRTVAGTFSSNTNIVFSGTVTYAPGSTYGTTVNKTIVAAPAQTYTWIGTTNTSWDTTTNWTPNGTPTATDNVIINAVGTNRLNITSSKSVKDFTLSGTGNFNMSANGVLTITGNVSYDGTNNAGNTSVLNCSSKVNITSSSPQNILPLRYGSLDAAGGDRTLISGRTTAICDLYNPGAGNYTVTGSTVEYYSPSTSTIYTMLPFTYHNLTFTGAATFAVGTGNTINVLGNYVQSGNGQVIVSRTGAGTLNITGNATVSNGILDVSFGDNAGVFSVGQDLTLSGSALMNVLNGTNITPTTTVAIGQDLLISGTARLRLEPYGTTSGNAIVNVVRDFIGTATGTGSNGMVDFGNDGATNIGNVINVGRNFSKSGVGNFWTSSSIPAIGFVMTGGTTTTPATFSYAGANSNYTSYVIGNNANVKLLTDLTLGTGNNPRSIFTVNGTGTLNFDDKSLIGNTTTQFITNDGSTLITSNTNGIGGTTATGSLRSFSSTGVLPLTNGRAHLVAGVHYVYNANTTTPFPTTAFGNPRSLTFNNAQVVSNRTDAITVIDAVNINENAGFTLNSTSGNLSIGGAMTIENNAFFDNAGENQVIGTGSIVVKNNGTFITKDEQGFSGTNSATTLTNITLEPGSIVQYNKNGVQTVSNQVFGTGSSQYNYQNLEITGTGVKTGAAGNIIVNQITKVNDGAKLHIAETADHVAPNVLTAKGGINVSSVAGTELVLQNNANLMQDAGVLNSGNITQFRKANVPSNQYNYWTYPVKAQQLYSLYDGAVVPANKVMQYNPQNDYFTVIQNTPMALSEFGKGYSVRGPASNPTGNVTAKFVGEPNNQTSISAGNEIALDTFDEGNNFNLIGNPFPSNLDLTKMYDESNTYGYGNKDKFQSSTAYFWDNVSNTETTQQGSGYGQSNYATLNIPSGVGTAAPCTTCTEAASSKKPNGIVKPGQGFIVNIKGGATQATTSIKLNNAMRTTAIRQDSDTEDAVYFKNVDNGASDNIYGSRPKNDKFWIELVNPNGLKIQIAVGYFERADNTFEIYDSKIMSENVSENIYSLSKDAKKLTIQGRQAPFEKTDVIPLGTKFYVQGKYKIQLEETVGIFKIHQNIYLKDKYLNEIHNLSQSPYDFEGTPGVFEDRFEIIFQDGNQTSDPVLSTASDSHVKITKKDHQIEITSSKDKILEVEIFNLSGWSVYKNAKVNSNALNVPASLFGKQIVVVKVQTETGKIVTKKIINK